MAIDDSLKAFFASLKMPEVKLPDFSGMSMLQTADRLRGSFFRMTRAVGGDAPTLAEVSTMAIDGAAGPIKGRLYVPMGAGVGKGPAIVFYHGGGFAIGDLESHDMICRRLADSSRCRVVAVDYRRAPEHKFPAAHDDALAAWKWVVRHAATLNIDTDRLAICGDSAGGNLAISIAQYATQNDGEVDPAFQLLLYPLVQFVDIRAFPLSLKESGIFISHNLFDYYRDAYIGKAEQRMDPRVSPLFAGEEILKGQPPAHIVLCGWDPLRHEGTAYADKLASCGVPVTVREHEGMVHGFMNLTAMSKPIHEAIHDAGHVVGRALGALSTTDR